MSQTLLAGGPQGQETHCWTLAEVGVSVSFCLSSGAEKECFCSKTSPAHGSLCCSTGKEGRQKTEREMKERKVIIVWQGLCMKLFLCLLSQQYLVLCSNMWSYLIISQEGVLAYSSCFLASNMQFGARPRLNFNKQLEWSVLSTMRTCTALWLSHHVG